MYNRALSVDLKMNVTRHVHFGLEMDRGSDNEGKIEFSGLHSEKAAEPFFKEGRMENTIERMERELAESGRLEAWNKEGLYYQKLEERWNGLEALCKEMNAEELSGEEEFLEELEGLRETLQYFRNEDGIRDFIDDTNCGVRPMDMNLSICSERVKVCLVGHEQEHYSQFLKRRFMLPTKLASQLTGDLEDDGHAVGFMVSSFTEYSKSLTPSSYDDFIWYLLEGLAPMVDISKLSTPLFEDFIDPLQVSFFNHELGIGLKKFKKYCGCVKSAQVY